MANQEGDKNDYYIGSWAGDKWKVRKSNTAKSGVDVDKREAVIPDADTPARRATRLFEGLRAMQGKQDLPTKTAEALEELRLSALANKHGIDVSRRFDDRVASLPRVGPKSKDDEVIRSWLRTVGAASTSQGMANAQPQLNPNGSSAAAEAFKAAEAELPADMRKELQEAAAKIWNSPDAKTRDQVTKEVEEMMRRRGIRQGTRQRETTSGQNGRQENQQEQAKGTPSDQENENDANSPANPDSQQPQASKQPSQQQPTQTKQPQPGENTEATEEPQPGETQDGSPGQSTSDPEAEPSSKGSSESDSPSQPNATKKSPDGTDEGQQQQPSDAQETVDDSPGKTTDSPQTADEEKSKYDVDSTSMPRNEGKGGWGSSLHSRAEVLLHQHINRTHRSKAMRRPRGAADSGILPQHWDRWASDKQVFLSSRPGGTILIDGSGSMRWDYKKLQDAMADFPAMKVAIYGGGWVYGKPGGRLCILADKGRWSDLDADQRHFAGNDIDIEAITWLAAQKGPRVWLSDGQICGGMVSQMGDEKAARHIRSIANRKKIARAKDIDSALKYLRAHGSRKTDGVLLGRDKLFIAQFGGKKGRGL